MSEPERLSEIFGQALRLLHEVKATDCPITDKTHCLLAQAKTSLFRQDHLDDITSYIGKAYAKNAALEMAATHELLVNDVLIHGDYCLPNIMINKWRLEGFIDVADGGIGDSAIETR